MNIYDEIFAEEPNYNLKYKGKLNEVLDWAKKINSTHLLDVGCGRGHYIRFLRKKGFEVTGLEPTSYLIENDLKDLDVIKSDILGAVPDGYDAIYCMDVLEHINEEELNWNISALSKLAPRALFGIANHPDSWKGHELHVTQHPSEWWMDLLENYYNHLKLLQDSERFFIIEASNE